MKLHTVFITYNRLELTKQAIASYLETVTVPFTYTIVDNASTDGTVKWIMEYFGDYTILRENKYPGFAANMGWETAPEDATHFQRADNDNRFLPGWCEHIQERFAEDPSLGQLGLRTAEWDSYNARNVSGDCVVPRKLWDRGLRWDERPWTAYPPGHADSAEMAKAVNRMGYTWGRVTQLCIEPIGVEDPDDPYYIQSWTDRGILKWALKRHGR